MGANFRVRRAPESTGFLSLAKRAWAARSAGSKRIRVNFMGNCDNSGEVDAADIDIVVANFSALDN